MRILHVVQPPRGGAPVLVELLARSQSTRHDVGVVCRPAVARRLVDLQGMVWSVPMERSIRPVGDARDLGRLVRIVRTYRPDVIHAHSSKAGALGRAAGALTGVPVVFSPHNFAHLIHEGGPWLRMAFLSLERLLAPLTDHLHLAYEQEREQALRWGLARPGKVSVIPNGIATQPLLRLDAAGSSPPRVGTYARLWPQKQLDLLVRAAARLSERGRSFELLIIGDGPLRAELEQLSDSLGMLDHTHYLPDPGGPTQALAMIDVFVLSSAQEAFPLTPMEAMAAGRPVVATAVGAIPQIVEDGRTGFIVPAGDEPALAEALDRLLADSQLRAAMGEAARATAAERFDVSLMAERMDAVYRAAIGKR